MLAQSREEKAPFPPSKNAPSSPISEFPFPNMKANPMIQKARDAMEKSMKFFMRTLAVFLALCSPISSSAKPACMKKTSMAAKTTHNVFTA